MTSVSHATRLFGSDGEHRVEDRVGDLVGELVRVSLGDGFRGEEMRWLMLRASIRGRQAPSDGAAAGEGLAIRSQMAPASSGFVQVRSGSSSRRRRPGSWRRSCRSRTRCPRGRPRSRRPGRRSLRCELLPSGRLEVGGLGREPDQHGGPRVARPSSRRMSGVGSSRSSGDPCSFLSLPSAAAFGRKSATAAAITTASTPSEARRARRRASRSAVDHVHDAHAWRRRHRVRARGPSGRRRPASGCRPRSRPPSSRSSGSR